MVVRWLKIFILILATLMSASANGKSHMLNTNTLYIIPAPGDGDQKFLGKNQLVLPTTATWFNGKIDDEEAFLFTVVGGEYDGKIIALTSRVTTRLTDNLADYGMCSVVVYFILSPNEKFNGKHSDTLPIGMSILVRYEDSHIWDAK